ncbi:MAG: DNA gyrase inhibitor YacG [Planctomycetota bacterium]
MEHRCPSCRKIVKPPSAEECGEAEFFPFCSNRCKLVDLGAWLDAKYRIVPDRPPQDSAETSDGHSESAVDEQ